MSTVTRDNVMDKILGLIRGMTFANEINGQTAWKTVDNRLKLFNSVDASLQPAAYLVTHRETDEYRSLGLLRRRLDLGIWCYARSDNSPGAPALDTMMEAFEATFCTPDSVKSGQFTLGGMVYWCRIEGKVFKDPGDIDNQAMLVVPLVVEMP